jgi:hypothetical protein
LETDLPGGQYGMAEEFTEKLIEKVPEYVFLYDTGHPVYKNGDIRPSVPFSH